MAQTIGHAFHVAYMEFLKANGIDCQPSQEQSSVDYQEVLNQQQIFGDELSLFANKDLQKEVTASHWSSHWLIVYTLAVDLSSTCTVDQSLFV